MVLLSNNVNFSTTVGHESANRLACETTKAPQAKMIIMVSKRVMAMANILFTFSRTNRLTTGLSKMAMIKAKMSGMIML